MMAGRKWSARRHDVIVTRSEINYVLRTVER